MFLGILRSTSLHLMEVTAAMYPILLAAHNILRWAVVIAAAWVLVRGYRGWAAAQPWTRADRLSGLAFTISVDIQLLIGLFLAAVSPLIRPVLQDLSALGSSDAIRFFATEHIPAMVAAWVVVHVTSVVARRAEDDRGKHTRAAVGYTLAVVLVVLATPWWRPLFPGL